MHIYTIATSSADDKITGLTLILKNEKQLKKYKVINSCAFFRGVAATAAWAASLLCG